MIKRKEEFKSILELPFSNFPVKPWLCKLPIKDGELFTSWLSRVARNHASRFFTFCSSYFQNDIFWNRDLDLNLPEEILQLSSSKSLVAESRLLQATLRSYNTYLVESVSTTRTSFITPINFYSQNRSHKTGLSICPSCLKEDGDEMYYRIEWRLALSVVCFKCKIYLVDKCPNCKTEVNYLRGEVGYKNSSPMLPISCCWSCFTDLSLTKTKVAPQDILRMQETLYRYLSQGFVHELGLGYSHIYFAVLRKIITILNSTNKECMRFSETLSVQMEVSFTQPAGNRRHPFEVLPIETRAKLLCKAFWVLEEWPTRFESVVRKSRISSKWLLQDFYDCPYFYYQAVHKYSRRVYSEWRALYPSLTYGSYKELVTRKRRKKKMN